MTRKRPKRIRLATGIYQDQYGISIVIRGSEKGNRYPLGTPLAQLRRIRKEKLDEAGAIVRGGTVSRDIDAYLETLPIGRARQQAATECEHWRGVFGDRASADLKPIEIRQQLAAWEHDFSKKHLNNLIHRLRAVFSASHGRALNPALDVKVYTVRYDDARAIPYAWIERIISGMPDRGRPVKGEKLAPVNLAQLRLRVMAYTGLSQMMLQRVEPQHLDLRKKTVYVSMRLKGHGVVGDTVKLTDRGVKAFRALVQANGLGPFSTRSLAHCWSRAITRERKKWIEAEAKRARPRPWPLGDDVRAYDLRHSFGTWSLAVGGDLSATAHQLRHRNLNTTGRYAKAAAALRAELAVAKMNQSPLP